MKKLNAAFAAVAMAVALTPALSLAQDAPQQPANPFAEGALQAQLPTSACTSDGFTDEGAVTIVLSASDVKKLGDGDVQAGIQKIDIKALKAELDKAWKAFSGEVTSDDLSADQPSEKVGNSLKAHMSEFAATETKATGVHIAVAEVGWGEPTPGCTAPAPGAP